MSRRRAKSAADELYADNGSLPQVPPIDMHGLGESVTGIRIAGAKHSDYWGHFTTAASLEATEAIAAFFGFGSPRRKIGARTLGS